MICSPFSACVKHVIRLSGCVQRQMTNHICGIMSQEPCSSFYFSLSTGYSSPKYVDMSVAKTNSCSSVIDFQALQKIRFGSCISKQRINWHSLMVKNVGSTKQPQKICLDLSLACQHMNVKVSVPRQRRVPNISCNVRPVSGLQCCASAGLTFGLLVCYSNPEPVHAEEAQPDKSEEDTSVSFLHGKKVYTDYSVTGIPGDGRCLFRSVVHGACLRLGKPSPDESLQRALADELRARVADEFVKRREETEWFIEGDFDGYIAQIRKPHVWGGEPELLMASHVLQMPITVYMNNQDSSGLIAIAEYGQEYGKENPIRLLYYGYGHYDALQIPGKKGARSRM